MDADLLDGQHGSYYLDRTKHTGTQIADTIVDGVTNKVYTATEKTKLYGISTGAEVNQNAFSNIKVGTTTVSADTKTDTLEICSWNRNYPYTRCN